MASEVYGGNTTLPKKFVTDTEVIANCCRAYYDQGLEAGIAEERERCAKILEGLKGNGLMDSNWIAKYMAERVRSGK